MGSQAFPSVHPTDEATMLRPLLLALLLCLPGLTPAAAAELPIQPGDRLALEVLGERSLSREFLVDSEGAITLPLVGKVPVKGMSIPAARDELVKRISRYVRQPDVTLEFGDRAEITVAFTGLVLEPGQVRLKPGSTMLDALAAVGGLMPEDVDDTRVQIRRAGSVTPLIVDVKRLLQGESSLNVTLQEGDAVFVPPLPKTAVRVLGAVVKPGEIKRMQDLTLLEAVQAAGGPRVDADLSVVQVLRRGSTVAETVRLTDVLTGIAKNPPVGDGDVVTVNPRAGVVVKVFGSVKKPGETPLGFGATVVEAVTAAGGFAKTADPAAAFITGADGEVRTVDLTRVDGPGAAERLQAGDQLFVPEQALRRYSVVGSVHKPGAFPLPTDPAQRIYLTDALAQAGGLKDRAKKTLILVRKTTGTEEALAREIELETLISDPKANVEVLADDVLFVETSPKGPNRAREINRMLRTARRLIRRS
jgi:polysaccharide export outer membrane protein